MRSINYFLLLIAVTVLSCSKNEQPKALFTADRYESANPDYVFKFNNQSTNGVKYEWDFGDGTSSDLTSPSHKYEQKGRYTVRLTSINKDGDSDEVSQEVLLGDLWIDEVSFDDDALFLVGGWAATEKYFYFFGGQENLSDTNAFSGVVSTNYAISMGDVSMPLGIAKMDENNELVYTDYSFRMESGYVFNVNEEAEEKGFFKGDFEVYQPSGLPPNTFLQHQNLAGTINLTLNFEVREP